MRLRRRKRNPIQDAFDGLCERDAARLRAYLEQNDNVVPFQRGGQVGTPRTVRVGPSEVVDLKSKRGRRDA